MLRSLFPLLVFVGSVLLGGGVAVADAAEARFADEFDRQHPTRWRSDFAADQWTVEQGALRRVGTGDDLFRPRYAPQTDVCVETRLKLTGGGRRNFGVAVQVAGESYQVVRYYDHASALELLTFTDGKLQADRPRGASVPVEPAQWYRLQVVATGDRVVARLWPEEATKPDWQLDVTLPEPGEGTFALVSHDDTQVAFDWVRASTSGEPLETVKRETQTRAELRLADLRENLELAVVADSFPASKGSHKIRRLHIVPYVHTNRHPVAGKLTVAWPGDQLERQVSLEDYDQNALVVEVPAADGAMEVDVTLATNLDTTLHGRCTVAPVELRPWRYYVQACLDTLIEHGRDQYGDLHTPLFMAVLDVDTLRSPSEPMLLDSLVRLEGRLHRRGERGSNLWHDQPLIKSLDRMSDLTDDDRYRDAAREYVDHFFKHCYKDIDPAHTYLNGMPAWGTHVYWDCFGDRPAGDGDGNGPHEILVLDAAWELMYPANPEAVGRVVDGIWRYHVVDHASGLHNRHDDGSQGCDFAFSGSSFAQAMAYMYHATGQQRYLDRARTIVNWHWDNRNLDTNLTADAPGITSRYDGHHTFTTVVGPHALGLLECYRLTGDPHFLHVALAYIRAYDRYGWNESEQTYWAMIKLDGTPVPNQQRGRGYDAYAPYGPIDVWRTTIFSYEFSLAAAQAAVAAYETTARNGSPDSGLLQLARRWGSVVERALPPKSGRRWKADLETALPRAREIQGAYAEDYGRAISLFVHLHRATGEERYLELANTVAEEAVTKLFRNGLFVGHPAKPYYETTNGVGLLLLALLELDDPEAELGGAW